MTMFHIGRMGVCGYMTLVSYRADGGLWLYDNGSYRADGGLWLHDNVSYRADGGLWLHDIGFI